MYLAKVAGKNRYQFSDTQRDSQIRDRFYALDQLDAQFDEMTASHNCHSRVWAIEWRVSISRSQ
jgi:hypothetical protein